MQITFCQPQTIESMFIPNYTLYYMLDIFDLHLVWCDLISLKLWTFIVIIVLKFMFLYSSSFSSAGLTCVEENWLPTFAPYKCTFSKPVDSITPSYNEQTGRIKCHMTSTFGRCITWNCITTLTIQSKCPEYL